jgi:ribosome hibernation promoting factor
MRVQMQITGTDVAEALKAYVERRLRFALDRFGSRVGEITIRIGTEGRLDRRCRISVEVLPFGKVSVEESDPNLFTAIDRAAGSVGRQFGRELERMRQIRLGRESIRWAA